RDLRRAGALRGRARQLVAAARAFLWATLHGARAHGGGGGRPRLVARLLRRRPWHRVPRDLRAILLAGARLLHHLCSPARRTRAAPRGPAGRAPMMTGLGSEG